MLPLRDRLPSRTVPYVNYLLLAANILAFLWMRSAILAGYPLEQLVGDWGVVPSLLWRDAEGVEVTVVSSMFVHDPSGLLHILGNMLFHLFLFFTVEDTPRLAHLHAFYV